jgi:hypothetical protein
MSVTGSIYIRSIGIRTKNDPEISPDQLKICCISSFVSPLSHHIKPQRQKNNNNLKMRKIVASSPALLPLLQHPYHARTPHPHPHPNLSIHPYPKIYDNVYAIPPSTLLPQYQHKLHTMQPNNTRKKNNIQFRRSKVVGVSSSLSTQTSPSSTHLISTRAAASATPCLSVPDSAD